jgi:hypothetical protein
MNTTTQTQPNALDMIITEHNTVDNAMIQHFGDNTVRIITDNDTKKTGLFVNDELKLVTSNLTVAEYEATIEAAYILWTSMFIKRMS